MNNRIRVLTAAALAAIGASVAIPALTGAQASPARSAHAAYARPGASQADQLRALERRRVHALVDADTATAGGLMARDFHAIPPSGDPLARKDYLGAVAAGVIDYRVFEPVSRIAVSSSGDLAALRYKVSFDLVAGETRVTHKGWITELWESRNGRWQIAWEQATAIPNNFDLFLQSIEPPAVPAALAAGSLSGKWTTTISGSTQFGGALNGNWVIKFSHGAYHVSQNGKPIVHGKDKIAGNVITLKDAPGPGACPTKGKYRFTTAGKTLTFKRVHDSTTHCIGRGVVLSHTFTKM